MVKVAEFKFETKKQLFVFVLRQHFHAFFRLLFRIRSFGCRIKADVTPFNALKKYL